MDGVLLINKPAGCTSHDVCQMVKRKLRAAKVGHTGTLDPLATGVLVLCINSATKLVQFLMHGQKEYAGRMRFGLATDTQDIQGEVLAACDSLPPDKAAVAAAARRLTGEILQLPPMYSALKKDGVPLYRLARQGKTVERQARQVTVFEFEITAFERPDALFRVVCSPGTYVRTLCHDLGSFFSCGAVLCELERVRTGGFNVRDALSLAELEALSPQDICRDHLIALDDALRGLPEVLVDENTAARMRNGLSITAADMLDFDMQDFSGGQLLTIRQCGGGLVGVVRALADAGSDALRCPTATALKTVRVFAR